MISTDEELQQVNMEVVELYQNGEYSEAMELATQALEFGKKFLGSKHPITATSVNNMAILNRKIGEHIRA
jgi:hypothetical protein